MIGCDVVDLLHSPDWRRKGYAERIFSAAEMGTICSSDNPDLMVWVIWSMKESVYKAALNITRRRVFAPLNINCSLIQADGDFYKGEAETEGLKYTAYASYSSSAVFTTAVLNGHPDDIISAGMILGETNHERNRAELYSELLTNISKQCGVPKDLLEIKKSSLFIPFVHSNGCMPDIPAALSHHGRFGFYSYQI